MTHFMAAMIFGGTEKQGRHEIAKPWQPSFTLGKPRGENHGSHRWGKEPGRATDPTPAPPAGTPPAAARDARARQPRETMAAIPHAGKTLKVEKA